MVPSSTRATFSFSGARYGVDGRSAYLKWYQTPKAEDKDLALAALAELQITHLAKRYYHELSGGEKTTRAHRPSHCTTGEIVDYGRTNSQS